MGMEAFYNLNDPTNLSDPTNFGGLFLHHTGTTNPYNHWKHDLMSV